MVRTKVTALLAAAGWAFSVVDMLGVIDLSAKQSNFCLAAAAVLTAMVMLCVRRRPLGAAYDLGYENGRRDALLTNNSPDGGRLVELHRKVIEPLCDKMSV
jgi:hypothetical protein